MRVIFVPVADRPECAKALRSAFDLGQRLGANICGCHIRPHAYSDVSLRAAMGAFADNDAAWNAAYRGKKSKKSSAAAKALFADFAKRNGYTVIKKPRSTPGAVWLEKVGSPDRYSPFWDPFPT